MVYCSECGRENQDGMAFCGYCGAIIPEYQLSEEDLEFDISKKEEPYFAFSLRLFGAERAVYLNKFSFYLIASAFLLPYLMGALILISLGGIVYGIVVLVIGFLLVYLGYWIGVKHKRTWENMWLKKRPGEGLQRFREYDEKK